MTNRKDRKRRGGFTLVEVLLVLVILVIIAGLAVTAYVPMQKRAYVNAAKTQIRAFKGPLAAYRLDMGDYPSSLDELRMQPAGAGAQGEWNGPYLDRDVPMDPWRVPYQYVYPGQHDPDMPDISSAGPDKVHGNEDDITSWGPD
jgi:general secretion pathway protein G